MKIKKRIDSYIERELSCHNADNISRTIAYQKYYGHYPEIKWAYLASMVSRNAGWSMTDLVNDAMVQLLNKDWRRRLFMTYERSNWLIFSDAFPQLLIYKLSKETGTALFDHLLRWNVSTWMIDEWWSYWKYKDEQKLLQALIINEQNILNRPVLKAPFFEKTVFGRTLYKFQEYNHNNAVIFPSAEGELYGATAIHFTKLEKRVEVGNKLAWILFESEASESIFLYFKKSTYVGCRSIDIPITMFKHDHSFPLRSIYPLIYHQDENRKDWSECKHYQSNSLLKKTFQHPKHYCLTEWYKQKRKHLFMTASLFHWIEKKIDKASISKPSQV